MISGNSHPSPAYGRFPADFWREKEKNQNTIALLLIILIALYVIFFLGLGLLVYIFFENQLLGLGLKRVLIMAAVTGIGFGILHDIFGTRYAISRILKSLSADPPALRDRYHKRLLNCVEEMCIAAGIPAPEVRVIRSFGVNCMTVWHEGTARLYITEGAVSSLSRDELQAIIAHALTHIASGDTEVCTAAVGLAAAISVFIGVELLVADDFSSPHRLPVKSITASGGLGRRGGQFLFMMIIISVFSMVASVLAAFIASLISVNRKYFADAMSVQLTRNPEALASALVKITEIKKSKFWLANNILAPLCIVAPGHSALGDNYLAGELFTVHPPVTQRVGKLTNRSYRDLTDRILAASAVSSGPDDLLYHAYRDNGWQGPFTREELLALAWVDGRTSVCRAGNTEAVMIGTLPWYALRTVFNRDRKPATGCCCHCHGGLTTDDYEGALIERCTGCGGVLVGKYELHKIIMREEMRISRLYVEDYTACLQRMTRAELMKHAVAGEGIYTCPSCGKTMNKQYYSAAMLVIVDACQQCGKIFLHRGELEKLQIKPVAGMAPGPAG